MATQRDVQQLIQGLAPSGVNKGNPNTVYNNSPSAPAGGGGGPIPTYDGNGNWYLPEIAPAATMNLGMQAGNGNFGGFNWMGNGGSLTPLPTTPPGNTGGVQPPVVPGGGTGPGGNLPPGTVPPNNVVGGVNGGPLGGLGGGSLTPQNSLSPWQGGFNGSMFGQMPPGGGGSFGGSGGGGFNIGDGTGHVNGFLGEWGGINWDQVLDAGTEPLLGGNFYDANTGKWNLTNVAGAVLGIPNLEGWWHEGQGNLDVSNILASLGQMATGGLVPFGSLVNRLGQYGASQGWSQNNPFVDAWLDNSREAYIQQHGQLGPVAPNLQTMMPFLGQQYAGAGVKDVGYAQIPDYTGGSGGSASGPGYNAATAAMGGASSGGVGGATQGHQWTGVSGDAARSMFGGMSSGATDALQHAEMMAMKLQRQ